MVKKHLAIAKNSKSGNRKARMENRIDKVITRASLSSRLHTLKMIQNEIFFKLKPSIRNIPTKQANVRLALQNNRLTIMSSLSKIVEVPILFKDEMLRIKLALCEQKAALEICLAERFLGLKNTAFLLEKVYVSLQLLEEITKQAHELSYNGSIFWSTRQFKIDPNKFRFYINNVKGDNHEFERDLSGILASLSRYPIE